MATVIGVFDSEQAVTAASDALGKAGLGDDVTDVMDHDAEDVREPVAANAVVGTTAAQPGGAVVGTVPDGLASADLSAEERGFFERSVTEGGRLIILDTDKVSEAKSILQDKGASRVYPES